MNQRERQALAAAAAEYACAAVGSLDALDAKYRFALAVQPGLPLRVLDAFAILLAAGIAERRAQVQREALADKIDRVRGMVEP